MRITTSIKLTLKQLLLAGAHTGYVRKFLHGKMKGYLIGFKGMLNLFDIKYTLLQLKMVLHLIINLTSFRQTILLFNHQPEAFILNKLNLPNNFLMIDGPWMGGLLTNHKVIKLTTNYFMSKQRNLPQSNFLPAFILFLNTIVENWGLKESWNLTIPNSAVIGSDFTVLEKVHYPIISNDKSTQILAFHANLLQIASWRGFHKEQLRILKIS